jgi:arylsulfatase
MMTAIMLPRLAVSTAVAIVTLVTVAAQSKPDFSGRWTTDPEPSAAPAGGPQGQAGQGRGGRGDMGSGWGSTITITQDAATLAVTYAFFGRGDMQPPLKFAYALDGSETTNTVMMGRGIQKQTSKTSWDGSKLVITTIHTMPSPDTGKPTPVEVKQILSLDSPTSLIVETIRSGVMGGPATSTKSVYRKI